MVTQLVPFEKNADTQAIGLSVSVSQVHGILQCRFELTDPKKLILVPNPKTNPSRMRGLWKSTCFEVFWKETELANYWEMNLSPSLDWNVFGFQSYRSDIEKEDLRFESVACASDRYEDRIIFDVSLDLKKCAYEFRKIQVSCTAVLEHKSGAKSYWAFKHPGIKPDFHHQDSFMTI